MLTWKFTDKAKTRLFVLDFQLPDLTHVLRDSVTLPAQAEGLILQCVASNKWKLVSGDIKTALLFGDEEHRKIFILLPDDVRDVLKLSPESMLRSAKQSIWSRERPDEMVGPFEAITPESLIHIMRVGSARLRPHQTEQGPKIDGVHMDDLLGGGDEVFERTALDVKREVDVGAWDVGAMRFKERQLTQMANLRNHGRQFEHYKHNLSHIEDAKVVDSKRNDALSWWP